MAQNTGWSAAPTRTRFATAHDIPAIVSLTNAACQVDKFFKVGERTEEAEIRQLLETGRFLLLCGTPSGQDEEQADELLGCVYLELRGERSYLGMLAVAPRHQRRGLATRLLAAGEEFLREMGARFVDITVVNVRTELQPIYERYGYRATGTAPYPSHRKAVKMPCHFVLMSKPLQGGH